MVMEGVMDICDKKNPKAIVHRLKSYSGKWQKRPVKRVTKVAPSSIDNHASNLS